MKVKALKDCFIENARRKAGAEFELSGVYKVIPKYIKVLDASAPAPAPDPAPKTETAPEAKRLKSPAAD